jgi:hypothetical protein
MASLSTDRSKSSWMVEETPPQVKVGMPRIRYSMTTDNSVTLPATRRGAYVREQFRPGLLLMDSWTST